MSAALSGVILVGVLTAFLLVGRVSANIENYSEIESNARKALEIISRDARAAYKVQSYSATSVDLAIPDSTASAPTTSTGDLSTYPDGYVPDHYVEYAYDSAAGSITRTIRDSTHGTPVTSTLLNNVQQIPDLSAPENYVFHYYRYINTSAAGLGAGYVNGPPIPAGSPGSNEITSYSASTSIQQIEMKFFIVRRSTTVNAATNKVLSARFILRNKR